ncbi:hypothetical protein HYT84_00925 [Candidatus Micrarchaeota archaeon]|nr:hypothetical protein [Candidatus Micrarchaeota archaeon]
MFDITDFEPRENHGFKELFNFQKVKSRIKAVEKIADAGNFKNKEVLIYVKDFEFDVGAIKVLGDLGKACFLVDLSKVIQNRGVRRAIELSKIRRFLYFCNKYKAFYAFASFAKDEFSLRRPHELVFIGTLLGLNRGQAKFALERIGKYL